MILNSIVYINKNQTILKSNIYIALYSMPAIIEDETYIQISNTTSNCSKM